MITHPIALGIAVLCSLLVLIPDKPQPLSERAVRAVATMALVAAVAATIAFW